MGVGVGDMGDGVGIPSARELESIKYLNLSNLAPPSLVTT